MSDQHNFIEFDANADYIMQEGYFCSGVDVWGLETVTGNLAVKLQPPVPGAPALVIVGADNIRATIASLQSCLDYLEAHTDE